MINRPLGVLLDNPSSRQQRAMQMLIDGLVPLQRGKHEWAVESSSKNVRYRVRHGSCNCPDDTPDCKHVLAVEMWKSHIVELQRRVGSDESDVDVLESLYESLLESRS